MAKQAQTPHAEGSVPIALVDVVPQARDMSQGQPDAEGAGNGLLQELLPEITELARKVGGFRRLAEIAAQLDRAGAGR